MRDSPREDAAAKAPVHARITTYGVAILVVGLLSAALGLLSGAGGREPLHPGRLCLLTFTEKAAAEMRELVRRSTKIRVFEPDPDTGRWDALYDRFLNIARIGQRATA